MATVSKGYDSYQVSSLFLLVLKITDDCLDSFAQVSGSYKIDRIWKALS